MNRLTSLLLAIMAMPVVAGCGPEFAVLPQGGAPLVTVQTQGVYLSAFADQWDADPHDLADYVTPIAVDLYNGTGTDIRVAYSDFALRGADGFRRPAINPFAEPIAALDGAKDGLALDPGPLLASAGPILVARGGGGWGRGGGGHFGGGGGHFGGGGGHFGGSRSFGGFGRGGMRGGYVGPPPGRRWSGGFGGPRVGPGFYVHGGLRGWYGPGVYYWNGPWTYPLGYSMWVYGWGSAGYGVPSSDVMDLALPEGVLSPGAHVNGFLYFRKATGPDVRTVTLTWTPVDARSGSPVGDAQVTLDVVHR